ncbi:MAG: FtsX-like permease family protein [bacterium]|nr:FtsX-like permease family protein [bacterium]
MTTKTNLQPATFGQMTVMALRYLSGRKLRTVLTTLAIVFGVALIFAINLTLPLVLETFTSSLSVFGGADVSITSATGASFAPDAVLSQVAAVDGVNAVSGVLRRQFSLPTTGSELGSARSVELIGVDPTSIQDVRQFALSEGRFLQPDDSGAVVMPAAIAEIAPQLTLDTTFPLISAAGLRLYRVVGLTAEQGNLSVPPLYMTLADVQAAFGQNGLINTIEVAVEPGADRAAVTEAILSTLGSGFISASGASSDLFATVQIGLIVMNLFGVLALFLGAFLIFNTFRTIVVERRRDLSMLRAIGATRRQVTSMILIESLLQGLIGTLIGLLLGYGLAALLISFMGRVYSTYFPNMNLVLRFNPGALALAVVLGLLTSLLAGYWPARAAGRTTPLAGLRPATTATVNRATRSSLIVGAVLLVVAVMLLLGGTQTAIGGAVLFLFAMIAVAPGLVIPMARLFSPLLTLWFAREGDLSRGNLQRQPGRAAITASTLMIGLAVLILMAAVVSAFGVLLDRLAGVNFSSDVIITPPSLGVYTNVLGADESLSQRLADLPEVEAVASLRYATSTVNGTDVEVLGIDPTTYPQVASLSFSQGDPDGAFADLDEGRTAVVSGLAASTLGLELGGDVVLQTVNGPQTYRIVGVGDDLLSFKLAAVFVSQANLAADFNKAEDVLLMLNFSSNVEQEAGLAAVEGVLADYPQFTAHLTGQYRDELIQTSSAAFGLFYGLAVLILIPAALGLLNTLTINILERTREIGITRAVGGSQKQIRRMVTGEALLLGILGASLGVVAGVVMSYGFIGAFESLGWQVPYLFPVAGVIAAVIVGMILALFASILPARNAAKLDIIRALQYE